MGHDLTRYRHRKSLNSPWTTKISTHKRLHNIVCKYLTSADVPKAATFEKPISYA